MRTNGQAPMPADPHDALRWLWAIADHADPICRQHPELFFPSSTAEVRHALNACHSSCSMQAQCGQYGRATDQRYGVWGGIWSDDGEPLPP